LKPRDGLDEVRISQQRIYSNAAEYVSGFGAPQRDQENELRAHLTGRDNGFGLLRLLFATLVLWDHAFPLGGFNGVSAQRLLFTEESVGGICVAGFFAISGFLIAKSGMTATDCLQFAWRRCVRIFPAYWAVLVVTAVCVGPCIQYWEKGTVAGYWNVLPGGPLTYMTRNWWTVIHQYGINSLLRDSTPYGQKISGSVFNGSVWTLIYEIRCYIAAGILAMLGVLTAGRKALLSVTAIAWMLLGLQAIDISFPARIAPWLADLYLIRHFTIFLLGACAAAYSKTLPINDRLGICAIVVYLLCLFSGGYFFFGYPAMVYWILWLACRLPQWLRRIGSRNDYSYGVYVFGFLVQQVLAYIGIQRYGLSAYLLATLIMTFACAWCSWHGLEKHALRLKDWGPGRGWHYWLNLAKGGRMSWR